MPRRNRYLVIIAALLVARELGWADASATAVSTYTSIRMVSLDDRLAPTEVPDGRVTGGPSNLSITYTDNRSDPWTRWLPFLKFGETRLYRRFVATRANRPPVAGMVTWIINQTQVGSSSARHYTKSLMPKDSEFISAIEAEITKTGPQNP